ncbi:methylated-DNA--[protein]-cysteine S-methyltransferase [Rhizomonospora bruguierae]|uniref:methylated-DNA--[protein]-cysteine S-methyltransferase n=1 Tax=Rhizomonospora bruguierae TaxID=1581705 RepID=UPI0024BDADAA|nr:methylated-DNA--[protein]-cysteine S-methyltransferase [Micromonospora sp. NBRC 107566]
MGAMRRWTVVDSPIGELSIAADEEGVCGFAFQAVPEAERLPAAEPMGAVTGAHLGAAARQLAEYFAGQRTEFALPLHARRGSAFERAVWAELSRIPYGETRTYGQVAAAAGDPGAARAVGVACNRNPIAVIVPCHRVVGAGGKLVGFGGGLPRKRYLLELEARVSLERAWAG